MNNESLKTIYKVCDIEKIEVEKRIEKKDYLKIKKGEKFINAKILDTFCKE
ncbi:MAG: hypothetical protein NC834_04065 [Candidatus Omnitrophica bacterium]|nr:hypothetical protein [Candidatus Omnitrophota bacterium]